MVNLLLIGGGLPLSTPVGILGTTILSRKLSLSLDRVMLLLIILQSGLQTLPFVDSLVQILLCP